MRCTWAGEGVLGYLEVCLITAEENDLARAGAVERDGGCAANSAALRIVRSDPDWRWDSYSSSDNYSLARCAELGARR
jgi:hypothetical protein